MAAKLTVVISQSAQRSPAMVELEESILTQVMMAPDLDAVLVGPFEGLTAEGTDALCLSKLPRESVMLGWPPIDLAANCLRQSNVNWRLAEALVGQEDTRRYLRLSADQDSSQVLAILEQIQKNLSVKTLQISLAPIGKKNAPAAAVQQPPRDALLPSTSRDLSTELGPKKSNSPAQDPAVEEDNLDQLLDELDSLNL